MEFSKKDLNTIKCALLYCKDNTYDESYAKLLDKIKYKKPIKISSRKAKGRNLQKWVCERIANLFGVEYVQGDDDCLVHSREMGQSGSDIIMRGIVKQVFPLDIECKAQENLNVGAWIEQAKSNTGKGKGWGLVIKKKSIGEPIIIMSWDNFEKIISEYIKLNKG